MSMRITNQMITNNSLRNMQKSMDEVNTKTQQMTSGKKISKASEDPVTAIRALKLRTTVNQLTQYKDKNIPDANSWLKVTQTSLDNVTKRAKEIYEYCVQGSTDSFATDDRSAIIDALKEARNMIYDEGSATYAGRYIFSGYKTDRAMTFTSSDDVSKYSYDITEVLDANSIDIKKVVSNEVDPEEFTSYLAGSSTYEQPDPHDVYRLNLGYQNISDTNSENKNVFSLSAVDGDGNDIDLSNFTITVKDTDDASTYYDVGNDDINVIKETGEIVFGVNVYNALYGSNGTKITVNYAKNEFETGDIRPEMLYDCTRRKQLSGNEVETIKYDYNGEQKVNYEVNFNQTIQVNTCGSQFINSTVGNNIDDLIFALTDLEEAEDNQKTLKSMLEDSQYANNETAVTKINQMLSDIDAEIAVKKENMQKTFAANITNFQDYMNNVSAIQSDLGSRMSKLDMIKTRVEEQYSEFTELKSQNEDVETDEIIIDFNAANLVYETALAATSNVVQKTLLDYI